MVQNQINARLQATQTSYTIFAPSSDAYAAKYKAAASTGPTRASGTP
mgnify:CR=1 FL=1|tara:strand:+ start:508 stop:648 length:141 start_codon:yes stop_codon:yes gene_type:complete